MIAFVLAACAEVPSPILSPAMTERSAQAIVKFVDVDGPAITIEVNGSRAGALTCGESLVGYPGAQAWPILPWHVRILNRSGTSLKDVAIDATAVDTTVIIRADGVLVGAGPVSYGPAPTQPCPLD